MFRVYHASRSHTVAAHLSVQCWTDAAHAFREKLLKMTHFWGGGGALYIVLCLFLREKNDCRLKQASFANLRNLGP